MLKTIGIGIRLDGPYSQVGKVGRGGQTVIDDRLKESLTNRGALRGITSG